MNDIIQNIITAIHAQSWLEVVAAFTAILYLLLAVKENRWCWVFGFISTGIYVYLFYGVSLLSESLLNFYYLIMAVYGWIQWDKNKQQNSVKIHTLKTSSHIKILLVTVVLTPFVGYFMHKWGASFPYIDAFVAILAVIATLMTTRKIYENWHYWLLVDLISIYLYWQKQMYLTSLLFVIYIVLIFVGMKQWKKLMGEST
jgi:nicotinamide mononucleotide transporter